MANFQLAADLLTAIFNGITDKIRDKYYPIGSIYLSVNTTNPSTLFGGTWKMVGSGNYLMAYDPSNGYFDKPGSNKGSSAGPGDWNSDKTSLTIDQIPSHTHWQRSRARNDNIAQAGNDVGAEFLGTSGAHIRRDLCYRWRKRS